MANAYSMKSNDRKIAVMTLKANLFVLCLLLLASIAHSEAVSKQEDPLDFQRDAWPLLLDHCTDCHGEKKKKGGVSFTGLNDLPSLLGHREMWLKARTELEVREMPPEADDSEFKDEDRRKLIAWIDAKIVAIDRSNPIYLDPGPSPVRQLTRVEYNNTIHDLLKIDFDAAGAGGIASEDNVEGYSNLAVGLVTDQTLLEKYFEAADATLAFLFDGDPNRDHRKEARAALFVAMPSAEISERDAARKVLEQLARRAFRRPVEPWEIDRLMPLVDDALKSGKGFETAVRQAMKPVLVSPSFLYRLEGGAPASDGSAACAITNYELAARLSYFLWSTMPDDELLAVAAAGTLSRPQTLDAEVRRMLADRRAKAITEQFAAQWLMLGRLRYALPSRDAFPTLTNSLKDAMQNETTAFLDNLRTGDRSVLDLLDADYTFVNEELARHYGIAGVSGQEIRRVDLKPENHRGGLLGMGSILTLTSHTDRTKPTARGKWILQVILGTPPAPPPADAGNFKDNNQHDKPPPGNFREKLAQHASNATCAACHRKIDPLGFALENYDGIGAWREQVGGQPVDSEGKLPGTGVFKGVDGLKQVLHDRQDQFVRNLTVQMMSYALGRQVEYEDELAITEIDDQLKQEDYRFSALVRGVVASRPFQFRRSSARPGQTRGNDESH